MARVGVGVDFGTTNSVAAVYDGEHLSLLDLEAGGSVMPRQLTLIKNYKQRLEIWRLNSISQITLVELSSLFPKLLEKTQSLVKAAARMSPPRSILLPSKFTALRSLIVGFRVVFFEELNVCSVMRGSGA